MSFRTFLTTWIKIVLMGSAIATVVYVPLSYLFDAATSRDWSENFFYWIFFSVAFSGLYSIPAQVILGIANAWLSRRSATAVQFQQSFMAVFFAVSALTFGVLVVMNIHEELLWMATCAVVFTATGWVTWRKACQRLPVQMQ